MRPKSLGGGGAGKCGSTSMGAGGSVGGNRCGCVSRDGTGCGWLSEWGRDVGYVCMHPCVGDVGASGLEWVVLCMGCLDVWGERVSGQVGQQCGWVRDCG